MKHLINYIQSSFSRLYNKTIVRLQILSNRLNMVATKRELETDDTQEDPTKIPRKEDLVKTLKHDKNRLVPKYVLDKLSDGDIDLIRNVKSSCQDTDLIKAAIKVRVSHRLCARLPEDEGDSSYYIRDGLRWVYPYQYIYQASAKRRWLGRKLVDVIRDEFRDISNDDLEYRFKMNRIIVSGESTNIDHVIKDNDFICNIVHRHELPVLAVPIQIVHEDSDNVVINKPPSLPIHPCGRFRWNSVTHVLKLENGYQDLKVCHRIDRLVSGVVLFAKNSRRAHTIEELIKNHHVEKTYVCRVSGEFPLGPEENDGEITVDQPLEHLPGKIGITIVTKEGGKPSLTRFKRLHYNGKTSSVLCKPKSGRMHQIRVHLQYLGHPIVNDPLYNSDAFGPERGKNGHYGKSLQELSGDILSKHRSSTWLMDDNDLIFADDNNQGDIREDKQDQTGRVDQSDRSQKVMKFLNDEERAETMAALEGYCTKESLKELQSRWPFDEARFHCDKVCRDCSNNFYDPPLRSLFMYLHALSYSGPGFHYKTELPAWALDSWNF